MPATKAQQQQSPIAGRQGTRDIAEREDAHEAEQQRTAREFRSQDRDQRRTHHDTERISADHMAGLGLADGEVMREIGQQAHGREFTRADREAADREGEFDQSRPPALTGRNGARRRGAGDGDIRHGDLRRLLRTGPDTVIPAIAQTRYAAVQHDTSIVVRDTQLEAA